MRVVGILSLLSMLVVGAVVGGRLLLVARRTRQLPELAMGLGLLLTTVLGGPVAAAGRLPALVATGPGDFVFGLGLALALSGIALFYVFTWRVFRPDSSWGKAVMALALLALGVEWLGLMQASAQGQTLDEIVPHTRPWAITIVAMACISFLWTGVESLAYYRMLRRRRALGLADPVVMNRFLLWAASGFAAVAVCGSVVASMLAGYAPLRDAPPLIGIASAAIVTSVAWYLAVLPPEAYLRFIRRRAVARA
jgi:hypothetical protein